MVSEQKGALPPGAARPQALAILLQKREMEPLKTVYTLFIDWKERGLYNISGIAFDFTPSEGKLLGYGLGDFGN